MQLEWAAGNLDGFKKLFVEAGQLEDSESAQRLLGDRDKAMAEKLAELLEAEGEATYFVVVGAAHYAVDGMVVDLLRDRGYDVQFVE